jgi:hypothetical protein
MKIDLDKMKITDIEAEVNRHARGLRRVEELSGN